jgi:pimeloyl-ACP methyl ester carboxylesterase
MPIKPVRDERINIGDISLHDVQWGEQGTPLVFAHGLTGNAFCFQALADELASDHRVFAYDPTGFSPPQAPALQAWGLGDCGLSPCREHFHFLAPL